MALGDTFAPALAIQMIDLFGVEASFILGTPAFDELNSVGSVHAAQPVVVTVSPPVKYKKDFLEADVQFRNSSIVYMKGNESFEPKQGRQFILSSVLWTILRVDPLVSGSVTAAYRLTVKA